MTLRARLEAWAHRQWSVRGPVAWLLSPFSLAYMAASRSRRERTVPNHLPVPVVVVGNIYVGGTGKTPVTIALVKELQDVMMSGRRNMMRPPRPPKPSAEKPAEAK